MARKKLSADLPMYRLLTDCSPCYPELAALQHARTAQNMAVHPSGCANANGNSVVLQPHKTSATNRRHIIQRCRGNGAPIWLHAMDLTFPESVTREKEARPGQQSDFNCQYTNRSRSRITGSSRCGVIIEAPHAKLYRIFD